MNAPRNELWATHRPCGWTWELAYLPMPLDKCAKTMKAAHCPKCGERTKIFVAKEAEIVATLKAREAGR